MAHGEPLHRSLILDTTAHLCYLLLITTLGPLQFGFHLVRIALTEALLTLADDSTGRAKCSSKSYYLRGRKRLQSWPQA
jgi:hypothetical protein